MNPSTKRKLRRFKYKARAPLAYVTLVAAGLILFLSTIHSCSETRGDTEARGVQYTAERR